MAQTKKLRGCYRRVLIFLLVIATMILAVGGFTYRRVGGFEGARYWMAGRALNNVEKQVLRNRPDGVSEADVHSQFQKVREANADRRTDLIRLYQAMRAYQTKFQKTKPSTGEVVEFLMQLEAAVSSEGSE
jgi:hypothetical protein